MLKRVCLGIAGVWLVYFGLIGMFSFTQGSKKPQAGSVLVSSGSNVEVPEATFFAFDAQSVPFRRNLHLTMVPAAKYPSPVLTRGPQGSFDEIRAEYYGTVIRIGDKYRMWYVGYGFEDLTNRTTEGISAHLGYAESTDGIHWVKPNLGLVGYHGNKANNLVAIEPEDYTKWYPDRNVHVLYEPEDPDPSRRYKMMLYVPYEGGGDTMVPLLSADGFRWRYALPVNLTEGPKPRFKQSSIAMPAEHLEGGSLVKVGGLYYENGQNLNLPDGTQTARVMSTFWSPDFIHWHPEKALSFVRWGYDFSKPEAYGVNERFRPLGEQVHEGAALWNRGNVLVGIYGLWEGAKEWKDRTINLGIITSVDAIHFTEPEPNFRFARRGEPGQWDSGGLLQGQGFENIGEKTYIWYGSWDLTASQTAEYSREKDYLPHGDIGLFMLRRDGFGYLSVLDPKSAKPKETFGTGQGSLITAPFRVNQTAASVSLNVELRRGELTVELLDQGGMTIPGYSSNDFMALKRSGLREPAVWKEKKTIPAGGPYRFRVRFECKEQESPQLYAVYVKAS
jgi:hypothetical protein